MNVFKEKLDPDDIQFIAGKRNFLRRIFFHTAFLGRQYSVNSNYSSGDRAFWARKIGEAELVGKQSQFMNKIIYFTG